MTVIRTTGPGAWTEAVLDAFSKMQGRHVAAEEFSGLKEPKILGDVLILPLNSLASGLGYGGSVSGTAKEALIRHMWKASWYGELEGGKGSNGHAG
ncbi:membrane-bound alpha-1,6- mannosyltransferase Initiation-specific [Bachmanniomyces sp. S44760]|nr:membrane-bound alpha-1,6- mannosyltransferase Initiation-specific [Bachmanniomyces sp. S44760]